MQLSTFYTPFLPLVRTFERILHNRLAIYAGYAAYASLLAVFPFIIFLVALAGFIGTPEMAEELIHRSLNFLPPHVVETLSPVIRHILNSESTGLLTFGILGSLWVASSGVEGLRHGLNRAHGVTEFRPLWKRRLQSAGIVIVGSIVFLLLALLLIITPLVLDFLAPYLGSSTEAILSSSWLRYATGLLILTTVFTALFSILPNISLSLRNVLPGAFLAAAGWIGLAALFSLYLANFGQYDVTYGSLGGIIITMVFFHLSITVLLAAAAFNATWLEKNRDKP